MLFILAWFVRGLQMLCPSGPAGLDPADLREASSSSAWRHPVHLLLLPPRALTEAIQLAGDPFWRTLPCAFMVSDLSTAPSLWFSLRNLMKMTVWQREIRKMSQNSEASELLRHAEAQIRRLVASHTPVLLDPCGAIHIYALYTHS